jgi:hypothetical protein
MKDYEAPIPNRDREGAAVKLTPEEARFNEAVESGEDALNRGEFLTHEQVGKRLERFPRSRRSSGRRFAADRVLQRPKREAAWVIESPHGEN